MQDTTSKPSRFLSKRDVVERTALSGTTLWRLQRAGRFPSHYRLSPGRVGWLETDVDRWIVERAQ